MPDNQPATKTYLTIDDQNSIACRLSVLLKQTYWTDLFFLRHGNYLAAGTLALSGFSIWHAGFVAWNMSKYSKGRRFTSIISFSISPVGGLIYNKNVNTPLLEPFRKENKWYYGVQAILGNQLSLLVQAAFSLGYTFTTAQMYGMMPVENDFMSRKHRANTFKYVVTRLAPFTRRLLAINVLSSAFLFFVATRSYTESCQLLARVNRKTLIEKEDY